MNKFLKAILFIGLISSCQSNAGKKPRIDPAEILDINYTGDADLVQFKMFEGISQVLKQDSITGEFKGVLEIPNINEAIFTYDIVVHKKDSLGNMAEVEPNSSLVKMNQQEAIEEGDRFLWIGKDRNDSYLENEELTGTLVTMSVTSEFLKEEREITVYTPELVNSEIPHIYFTDGSVVESYAPYIDRLISTNKIKPVKLIGIHSSSFNRYEEYVKGDANNELFEKHQKFVYNEVIDIVEREIENWEGRRYLFGFSNGAAFCMHEGLNNPAAFEEIIAFSTVDYISPMAQVLNPVKFEFEEYPKFYMGVGRYEESVFNDNVEFLGSLKANGIKVDFKEFVSGHDYNVWRIEFLKYLEIRFNK